MTEFIHYITRKDLALSKNALDHEYTHLTIKMTTKRIRYVYQIQRRKDEQNNRITEKILRNKNRRINK